MKNKLKIMVLFLLNIAAYGESMDYKYEMSELINKIRINAPKDYLVIQQNAVDLYYRGDELKRDWLSRIDGMSQESIYYGDPEYNDKTPSGYRKKLERRYAEVLGDEKTVFITNYTNGFFRTRIADRKAKKGGFVNYNAQNREASLINEKISNENTEDIVDLDDVRNYLYLLNPENFKNKKEYIDELSNTNYDLIVIDAFFKGQRLRKDDLDKIRYKKNGGKRIIISYFSIGEAEDYRYYWKENWQVGSPNWIVEENENWEGNYAVRYWDEQWHEIVIDYLNIIVESGFDGVFLDTVDTYYNYIYE